MMSLNLLHIPERTSKDPLRTHGLTVCIDSGTSCDQLKSFLEEHGKHVDILIFSTGVAYCTDTDLLRLKIPVCRVHNVEPVFDGLFLETHLVRKQKDLYLKLCSELDITSHIVSDTCIELPPAEKCNLISELAKNGVVYSRIGSSDAAHIIPPYKWIELMKAEFEAGSQYIFAHASETGNVGLYRGSGEVREGLVQELISQIPPEKIIWDAPQKMQQVYFIELLKQNVNLSAILPEHLLRLESMRIGLEASTFNLYLPQHTD